MKAKILIITVGLLKLLPAGAAVFPLKLAPGEHYLVDAGSQPFFIQGEAAWSIMAQLSAPEAEQYLSNRWTKGFNTIMANLIEHKFAKQAPANYYGVYPFTNHINGSYWDFTSINPDYFTNVDSVMARASKYGMQVLLFPAYAGFGGGDEGWYADMVQNGTNRLFEWGRFLGKRYAGVPNIIWVGGGDYRTPDKSLMDAVMNGILAYDTNHLMTAHADRLTSALDYYTEPWDQFNSTYTRVTNAYSLTLKDYQRNPVTPTFLIEAWYEGENGANDWTCRQEGWWASTSGAMGHVFGNGTIWHFADGWQASMESLGSTTITNLIKLMRTRPWWKCLPDVGHTIVSSGYGVWGQTNYVTCTREVSGKTVIVYVPQGNMTPDLDLTKVSGSVANAWWYDPRTGAATSIGSYGTTNTQAFTPPDRGDWVLVIDDAAQNYGPPGVQTAKPTTLNIRAVGGDRFELSSGGVPGQSYTIQCRTNFEGLWQTLTNVAADAAGAWRFDFAPGPVSTFYRWSYP